jgi:Lipocalin-like domain
MQSLVGTWKLVEVRPFDDVGRNQSPPLGPHPMGVMIFEAKRMLRAICDGRETLPPDVPSRAFGSYCGTYIFDGLELRTHVAGASTPELLADQVRHIRFDGPTRMKINPVAGSLGNQSHFQLVWEWVS